MTSKVTDNFKREFLQLIKNDIDNAVDSYYMGIARVEPYKEEQDVESLAFQRKTRETLLAVKTISSTSFVVPKITWSANTVYSAYDTNLENNYYVMNDDNEVFVCVEASFSDGGFAFPSTIKPSSILANGQAKTFKTSDGYRWRFLYTTSNVSISQFLTNDLMPVKKITSTEVVLPITQETEQRNLQDSAVPGEIIRLAIDSAGYGYDVLNPPTISIIGDGSGAQFTPTIDEGVIKKVTIDSDGQGAILHGSNYNYAEAVLSYGDAVLRPIISDQYGLSDDPRKTLKTDSLMLQASFIGDEFDTILAQNEFNQVVVIKNLKKFNRIGDSDYTGNTGLGISSFDVNTGGTQIQNDKKIITSSNAVIKVVYHDTTLGKLYYYQDAETGFVSPVGSTSGTEIGALNSVTITGENAPDIDRYSGEIMYINNIGSTGVNTDTLGVSREEAQTENIRVVIKLG